ncbi:MAG TPA: hypothetical protein VK636_17465 [Gemmatimonadaceae bacterium]|nr:hypothetical protein [Gemmatimonadaceae bacterium]
MIRRCPSSAVTCVMHRHRAAFAVVALVALVACSPDSSSPAPAADLSGHWTQISDGLPGIVLDVTQSAADLTADVSLSGRQFATHGTVTGQSFTLSAVGDPSTSLSGSLTSDRQLDVTMGTFRTRLHKITR